MPQGPIGPKPEVGPIERALAHVPEHQRQRFIAQALAQALPGSFTFEAEGVRFTISRASVVRGSLFEVVVAASDDNGTLPLDNPYQWHGITPWVSTGTYRVEPDGRGDLREVENIEENPFEAVKRQIVSVVLESARRNGWQP